MRGLEFFGRFNLLKGGIAFADRVTTVSERFRREMVTPAGGCGLDIVLRENSHKLSGILNGADYERWNPATDTLLPQPYDLYNVGGKRIARDLLLEAIGLAPAPTGPVFGMVTRLVPEKGFDVLMPVLDRLLSDDVRLIILGEGDPAYERALAIAAKKYRRKLAYRQSYDETPRAPDRSRRRYHPDSVTDRTERPERDVQFEIRRAARRPCSRRHPGDHRRLRSDDRPGLRLPLLRSIVEAFWDAIKRAREMFQRDPHGWIELVSRAMAQNFSWESAAQRYEELYAGLTNQAAAA